VGQVQICWYAALCRTLTNTSDYDVFVGSVGCLHIPGRTYHVDQFYLEDLIEARLRTTLAAEAAEAAAAKAAGASASHNDSSSSSSRGGIAGVLEASAAAAREAARRGTFMPREAQVVQQGTGNPKQQPSLYDWTQHLRGYLVSAALCGCAAQCTAF
jgi:hypothetical protein